MAAISRQWAALDDAERMAWKTWSVNNPVTDRLGLKQSLSGNAAYMMLNGRLAQLAISSLDVPPVVSAPPSLVTVTLTADIGAGDFEAAFTATPGATGTCVWVQAAVTEGKNQAYVLNKLKFLGATAAPATSPVDAITQPADRAESLEASIVSRFGTLIVGQLVTLYLSVFSTTTGLISAPYITQELVVSTGP
jgi:hypothetical protein